MPGWMKHKLETRLPGKSIDNLRYADDTTPKAESEEKLKNLLMKVKKESEKAGLKVNIQCRGPAPADPGYSKERRRRRGSGNNCLIKC